MDQGNLLPTLDSGAKTLRAAVAELPGPQLEELVRLDRYSAGNLIGKGGMGEVRDCHDVRLNRHIALKTATTRNKAELSRFVREAQVQGQLEHPSIVPVYELGVGSDGAPYFAMKRVRGESLFDAITRLAAKEPEALARYPRRKLLQAFHSVCQAVDYAHVNGWIHRDLKPANIMIGDFGEVYVLDWGLARRHDGKDDELGSEGTMALAPIGLTTPGSLMGTPGYMSPEQVEGRRADQRSDVYALGAILFEILTHEMLAKGATTMELLLNTRDGCDARARMRAPHADVPPELEAICQKATSRDPAQRYASVNELHHELDRVLAGERNLELRSGLAKQHAETAEQAMKAAEKAGPDELEQRKTALREVGLSLALDARNAPAMSMLVKLMQTAPKTTPPETQEELDEMTSKGIRSASRSSFGAFLTVFIGTAIMFSVTGSKYCALSAGMFLLSALAAFRAGFMVPRPKSQTALPALVFSNLAIMSLFFLDGPLTIVPAFAAANTLAYRIALGSRWRLLVVGLGLTAAVFPLLGSWFGLLPESFRYVPEGVLLLPIGMEFTPSTTWVLLFGFVGTIGIASIVVGRVRDSNTDLARSRAMQAWNLAQLLPPEAAPKQVVDHTVEPMCAVGKVAHAITGG